MARLPVPGGDDGKWGDILNDFLAQEHNADGTQKTLPITKGGTGATDATTARTNLGAPSDSSVVHLTGAEAIAGVKTFSNAPVVPDGSFTQAKIANLVSDLTDKMAKGELFINVKDAPYNAVGNDVADDTAAVQAALNDAVAAQKTVYIPAGTFRITSPLVIQSGVTVKGDGHWSRLQWYGGGILFDLTSKYQVFWSNMSFGMPASNLTGTLFRFTACFNCRVSNCTLAGSHHTGDPHRDTTAVMLRGDANGIFSGNCDFVACHFTGFGVAIRTSAQMNYCINCWFSTYWIGVWADDGAASAGHSMTDCTMASDPASTDYHIYIDGLANQWFLKGVWCEGANVGWRIGRDSGPRSGGPFNFSAIGCMVAASTVAVDIQAARQTSLIGITLSPDLGQGVPNITPITVNPTYARDGFAANLMYGGSAQDDIDPSVFPDRWVYFDRYKTTIQAPEWQRAVDAMSPHREAGTWVRTPDSTRFFGVELESSGTQNDSVTYKIPLTAEGDYQIVLYHEAFSDVGIYTFQMDGTTFGTVDGYNAAASPTRSVVAASPVLATGIHELTIVMATKNAAASNHRARINGLTIQRTA